MPASGSLRLIVGLGNPGAKYEGTRHNIGKALIEYIAGDQGLKFSKRASLKSAVVQFGWNGRETVLAYPATYMNLSGQSVRALADHFGVNVTSDLLVVVDEAALVFGKLRLRMRGSDGGHKGLRSIEQDLGTQDYARLRLGIGMEGKGGSPAGEPLENFVLEPFGAEERRHLPKIFKKGLEACRLWNGEDPDKAMSAVNPD